MTKAAFVRWVALLLTFGLSSPILAGPNSLVIISPHRKSIQDEYVPAFKEYYKQKFGTAIEVEWLDQGGTSDDLKFVRSKFGANPQTSGIDIFWGGGATAFLELEKARLLDSCKLSDAVAREIPTQVSGVALVSAGKTWYASALSSFGLFYNKKIVAMDRLSEPKTWEDVADPQYLGQLTAADPRHSGTANTMMSIILQTYGWDKGWALLTKIAANTRQFTQSSSDPIKAVVAGDVAAAMAIDFYALAKIGDLGRDNLGFVQPEGHTILDPDPIAILKGAPHRETAERFIDFVLSVPGQRLLLLPKGAVGGPRLATLGRMAVNPKAYEGPGDILTGLNPFTQKAAMKFDSVKASALQRVLNDLVGAVHVDVHKNLNAAWKRIIKNGLKAPALAELTRPPVTEEEALALTKKWDEPSYRNSVINNWQGAAKATYKRLSAE